MQHFELIPEQSLQTAQSSLLNEITPEVNNLLTRVSTYLDKLERREQSLVAKHELQQGRLDMQQRTPTNSRPASRVRAKSIGGAGGTLGMAEQLKMKQLKQKKERLQFAIDRLQLQAGQRERQLRKSMAVPQDIEF
jgi:DASH complex subunit SPC19